MTRKATSILWTLFLTMLLGSCHKAIKEDPRIPIIRLDQTLAKADSLSPDQAEVINLWLNITGDSSNILAESPAVKFFQPAIDSLLPDLSKIECDLAQRLPSDSLRIYGMIIPYRQSIITANDGVVLVGLNHYLGSDFKGYRGFIPDYLLHRKVPQRMAADIHEARIHQLFPHEYSTTPPTLLNQLMYQGAILLQCGIDGLFTPQQFAIIEEHEADIWQALIKQDLLYSRDPLVAAKLLQPSPASTMLGPDIPGQAALYNALQIARAYSQATGQTPAEMLRTHFYNNNQSLITSQYSPQN